MPANSRGLTVERYTPVHKEVWDLFVASGKNATFLFFRDYMDYHSDRFKDHSLVIFKDAELVSVLPANLASNGVLYSHQGLTYGGLVFQSAITLGEVLEIVHALLEFLHANQIGTLFYKRIPRFYNVLADDEVDYALFLLEARLCERNCALLVSQRDRLPLRKGRKSEISKAHRFGVQVTAESDFGPFWDQVLIPRLAGRYGVKPVHSLAEISLLAARFPQCIKQFSAYCGGRIVAGVTIYETPTVAHAQYSSVTEEGQKVGALDCLFGWLIDEHYRNKRYFDFGISNEKHGRTINHGLLDWKEAFGGRSAVQDFHEILPVNYPKLEPVLPPLPASFAAAARHTAGSLHK